MYLMYLRVSSSCADYLYLADSTCIYNGDFLNIMQQEIRLNTVAKKYVYVACSKSGLLTTILLLRS